MLLNSQFIIMAPHVIIGCQNLLLLLRYVVNYVRIML